jgi:hemerythrin
MSMLDWNPDWETGIEKVDQQHRALFSQLETLMTAIHQDAAETRIPNLLAFLANYVEEHFRDEEIEMEATGYPGVAAHRAIHNGLREKVGVLLIQFQKEPGVLNDDAVFTSLVGGTSVRRGSPWTQLAELARSLSADHC